MWESQQKIIDYLWRLFSIDIEQEYLGVTSQKDLEKGVRENVFNILTQDADNEYSIINSTIVRAHQHSAGARKKKALAKPSEEVVED